MDEVKQIRAILAADGGAQVTADALVDVLEVVASAGELGTVLAATADLDDPSLVRALGFFVARAAHDAEGAARNDVYGLVARALASGDQSALTNLCTAVQRLASEGAAWHPAAAGAPSELTDLLVGTLATGPRGVADALRAGWALAEEELLESLGAGDRARLARALQAIEDEEAAELASRLGASSGEA